VGPQGVVGLGPHPGDVLPHLVEVLAERFGIGPNGADRALQAQKALDLLPQLEGGVDLVAELAHPALELEQLTVGGGDPLEVRLGVGEAGGGAFHAGHLPLDFLAPHTEGVQVLGPLQDRHQGPELLQDTFRAADETLERERDVGTARIDGNDVVVRFAAAFQEGNHGVTPRGWHFGDDGRGTSEGTVQICATDMPGASCRDPHRRRGARQGRKPMAGREIARRAGGPPMSR
jgi:hypothetical protein